MGQERRTTGHRRTYPTRGIFPKYDEANNLDYHGQNDAGSQISHGDILNYTFVLDNLEDAKIELDRYRSEGFMVDVDKDTVAKEMSHGTISHLGLIVKEKPEGKKRRIILDVRRSGETRRQFSPRNCCCGDFETPSP